MRHRSEEPAARQRPDRAGRSDPSRWPCRTACSTRPSPSAPDQWRRHGSIHRHSPGSTLRLTLGADKGCDNADFVAELRQACVTPHVARKRRHSAIDARTTRHAGYALSQKRRKKIEEPFGWAKTIGGMAQTVLRGIERVRARFTLTMAACNLARLPRLLAV